MKLKTIEEIFKEIKLIPESELTKQYNNKKPDRNETIETKLTMRAHFSIFVYL